MHFTELFGLDQQINGEVILFSLYNTISLPFCWAQVRTQSSYSHYGLMLIIILLVHNLKGV